MVDKYSSRQDVKVAVAKVRQKSPHTKRQWGHTGVAIVAGS